MPDLWWSKEIEGRKIEVTAIKRPTKALLALAIKEGLEECFKREILEAFIQRSNRVSTDYEEWEELTPAYRKRKIKQYGFDRIGVATEELLEAIKSCRVSCDGKELTISIPSEHYSLFSKKRPVIPTPTAATLAKYVLEALQRILQ